MSHVETAAAAPRLVNSFTLPVTPQQFANGLRTVHYATDPDSTRYALGAVEVLISPDRITFTATDSRRLATFHIECSNPEPVDQSYLLNVFDCRKLFRAINSKSGSKLRVSHYRTGSAEWVEFSFDKKGAAEPVTMRCDIVEGRFPRWRDVIPSRESFSCSVESNTKTMWNGLPTDWGTAADFQIDENGIRLTPTNTGNRIALSEHAIRGQLSTSLDLKFVNEFMQHNSGPVAMFFDSQSACRFDCGNSIGVMMPLHRD